MNAFALTSMDTIYWIAFIADAAAKGMAVLLLAAGATLLLRRSSAAVRHMTWTLSILALILVPVLSLAMPQLQVPLLPDWVRVAGLHQVDPPLVAAPGPVAIKETPAASPDLAVDYHAPAAEPPSLAASPQPVPPRESVQASPVPEAARSLAPATKESPMHWSTWVLLAWLAGAALLLLPLIAGTAIINRQTRRAQRIEGGTWLRLLEEFRRQLGVRRRVILLQSDWSNIPVTCGIVRPKIILPMEADDWSVERRRVVLLHELAHIRRSDCLTQLLARLARVIYWFNPLVWLAGRMLRIEREQACDDLVLASGQKASDYAQHLLDIVRSLHSVRCPSLAAVAMARKSQFEGRLLAILDPRRNRRALTRLGVVIAAAIVAAVAVPLAVLRASGPSAADNGPGAESNLNGYRLEARATYHRGEPVEVRLQGLQYDKWKLNEQARDFELPKASWRLDGRDIPAGMSLFGGSTNEVISTQLSEGTHTLQYVLKRLPLIRRDNPESRLVCDEATSNMVEFVVLGPRDASSLRHDFGPTVEIEVSQGEYVDLVNAQKADASTKPPRGPQLGRWLADNNVDLFYDSLFPPSRWVQATMADALVSFVPSGAGDWSSLSADQVADALSIGQAVSSHVIAQYEGKPRDGRSWPESIRFKARDGQMGLLQIVGMADDGTSIHLRWKLIQPCDASRQAASQPATQPATSAAAKSRSAALANGPAWTAAEAAFKTAMNEDLSYGVGGGRTQQKAIAVWEVFLKREDVLPQQRLFATWRIGSLCSVNMYPSDKPDMARAAKLFKQARAMMPEMISVETINSTTIYGSLDGTDTERAERKTECYRWLRTRTPAMIESSAAAVDANGHIVGQEFYGQAASSRKGAPAEQRRLVSILLDHGKTDLANQIAEFITWSRDGRAVLALLEAVNDIADPDDMQKWLSVERKFQNEWDPQTVQAVDNFKRMLPAAQPAISPASEPATQPAAEHGGKALVQATSRIKGHVRGKLAGDAPFFEAVDQQLGGDGKSSLSLVGVTGPISIRTVGRPLSELERAVGAAVNLQGVRNVKVELSIVDNDLASASVPATQPPGSKLEFRIAPKASDLDKAELSSYTEWLKAGKVGFWWKGGRITGRMPDHAWLPMSGELTSAPQLITGEYDGQKYVLVSDKPVQVMVSDEGKDAWGLARVYVTKDPFDQRAIGFELDERGAELFAALTKTNIKNALAVVIDGKVVSAPTIMTAMGKTGMIAGRFTEQEATALVQALRAGMPPTSKPATQPTGQELTLEGPEITDASLAQLKGARLQSLMLYQTVVTDEGLAHLTQVAQIKKLYLRAPGVKGPGLAYLKRLPGLESLELQGTVVGEESLAHVAEMDGLRDLSVSYMPLTDAGLRQLREMSGLRRLNLYGCGVGDAGLTRLHPLKDLEALDLTNCPVTDAGLERLKAMEKLKELRIGWSSSGHGGITNDGLVHLAALKDLEELDLTWQSSVSSDGMKHLAALKRLRSLGLHGTNVQVQALEDMPQLERLALSRSQVESGLKRLRAMKNLSQLTVFTVLSDRHLEDMQRLKEALPNCAIGFISN